MVIGLLFALGLLANFWTVLSDSSEDSNRQPPEQATVFSTTPPHNGLSPPPANPEAGAGTSNGLLPGQPANPATDIASSAAKWENAAEQHCQPDSAMDERWGQLIIEVNHWNNSQTALLSDLDYQKYRHCLREGYFTYTRDAGGETDHLQCKYLANESACTALARLMIAHPELAQLETLQAGAEGSLGVPRPVWDNAVEQHCKPGLDMDEAWRVLIIKTNHWNNSQTALLSDLDYQQYRHCLREAYFIYARDTGHEGDHLQCKYLANGSACTALARLMIAHPELAQLETLQAGAEGSLGVPRPVWDNAVEQHCKPGLDMDEAWRVLIIKTNHWNNSQTALLSDLDYHKYRHCLREGYFTYTRDAEHATDHLQCKYLANGSACTKIYSLPLDRAGTAEFKAVWENPVEQNCLPDPSQDTSWKEFILLTNHWHNSQTSLSNDPDYVTYRTCLQETYSQYTQDSNAPTRHLQCKYLANESACTQMPYLPDSQ